jgi:hypothetical protein
MPRDVLDFIEDPIHANVLTYVDETTGALVSTCPDCGTQIWLPHERWRTEFAFDHEPWCPALRHTRAPVV